MHQGPGKRETREAIIDAAERVIARNGFRKMTMEDLAREAGVSKRTVYMYFKSKEDVGLASIERVVEQVHDRLQELLESALPPPKKLRLMLMERIMGRILRTQNLYTGFNEFFEVIRPTYMAQRQRFFDKEKQLIIMALRQGKMAMKFNFEDETQTAECLLSATNALLPYNLAVREMDQPANIEQRLDSMVRLLIRGLRAQPVQAPPPARMIR
jgi:AcrR family transcriptional regulator